MSSLPGKTLWRSASLVVAMGASAALFACSQDATEPLSTEPFEFEPAFVIDGIGSGAGHQFTVKGALWEAGWLPPSSVGTGVIRPFLGLQSPGSSDVEQGFNTDGDFLYNQHRTTHTNPLPLNVVPVINEGFPAREFLLDAHEADNDFVIEVFEVYWCPTAAAATYTQRSQFTPNPPAPCKLVYEIAGATPAPPINATDAYSSGSGNRYDYRILIPEANFIAAASPTALCKYDPSPTAVCAQHLIVWARLSDAQSTFEEFSTLLRPQVKVVKTPDGQTVNAGNPITFTMVVSNVHGTAENVVLTDQLPNADKVTWTTTTAGCTISATGLLTCNLGSIGQGASKTVTVTANTDDGDCFVYDNTANVTSSNAGTDSDTGQITVVNCKGKIVIIKRTVGGFGGPFSYTTTGTGLSAFDLSTTAAGVAGQATKEFIVNAGSYSVTESGPSAGWQFTSLSCTGNGPAGSTAGQTANIDLLAEGTVTCIYTNTRQAKLTIKKVVTTGSNQSTKFTFTPTGGWNSGATFELAHNETKTSGFLAPNATYGATETVPQGWELTNRTCDKAGFSTATANNISILLEPGDDVTCTFTDRQQAKLTIKKVVTTGSNQSTPFTFSPTGGWNGDSDFTLAHNETRTSAFLTPGTYGATETVPAGWALTNRTCDKAGFSTPANGVSVALAPGDNVTCTFTNQQLGTLIVQKVVNGTTTFTTFNFTRTVMPAGVASSFSLSHGQSSSTGQVLFPAQYEVCETNLPAGWPPASATVNGVATATNGNSNPGSGLFCWFATVAAGQTTTVVVTNTPPQPETAWAANGQGAGAVGTLPYPGSNWATYVEYSANKTVDFFASQNKDVGDVHFSAVGVGGAGKITISITLTGAVFTGIVKIQDYAAAPTVSNPSPGQFAHSCTPTTATTATCVVPANNFYGVHGVVIPN